MGNVIIGFCRLRFERLRVETGAGGVGCPYAAVERTNSKASDFSRIASLLKSSYSMTMSASLVAATGGHTALETTGGQRQPGDAQLSLARGRPTG